MASFSGLGIGLSLVFGCLFLGLVAELYYMLWYKKNRVVQDHSYTNYIKSLSNFLCFQTKRHNCDESIADPELGFSKKGFGEEGLDTELIRTYNLCGPPRFLFTIKEETKEDLESDDGRSRRRNLGDYLFTIETPVFTPSASPRVYNPNGFNFNPLFGGLTEAEVNRALSSPPPRFKFLRDAEEKLKMKALIEEGEEKGVLEEREGPFARLLVDKKREIVENLQFNHQSKVIPLAPSPLSIESI